MDSKKTKTEYLKDSYRSRLHIVAAINVVVFWGVSVLHADFSTIWTLIGSISVKSGITGLIAPIGAFLLDGLLSADTKARVVYWKYSHPLPGSRAFSVYLKVDTRADPDRLIQEWGGFPDDPSEQNRLWYRIYRNVEREIRVHEAHRAWLFARDLTSFSVLFFVIFGISIQITDTPWSTVLIYLAVLATQYLASLITARNFGARFVCTVLAVASYTNQR